MFRIAMRLTGNSYRLSFQGDENVLGLDNGDVCKTLVQ